MGLANYALATSVVEIQEMWLQQQNINRRKQHKPPKAFQINLNFTYINSNACLLVIPNSLNTEGTPSASAAD